MSNEPGLAPKAFDIVLDLARRVSEGVLEDEHRRLHGEHPLLVLVEASLESISKTHLSRPIYGFSRGSEDRLVIERRILEDANEREKFQLLLYNFESICSIVRRTGYTEADEEMSLEYFTDKFPAWMESVENWAKAEDFTDLYLHVSAARAAYDPIDIDIADYG